VQEALHNSVKHARAGRIDIRLHEDATRPGTLVVEVIDDGTGFDPSASHRGHLGIDGMRERARHLGGWLVIESLPTGSTTVRAVVPGIVRRPDTDRLDQ
jgi:signal transduction histidine kinase